MNKQHYVTRWQWECCDIIGEEVWDVKQGWAESISWAQTLQHIQWDAEIFDRSVVPSAICGLLEEHHWWQHLETFESVRRSLDKLFSFKESVPPPSWLTESEELIAQTHSATQSKIFLKNLFYLTWNCTTAWQVSIWYWLIIAAHLLFSVHLHTHLYTPFSLLCTYLYSV